MQNPILYFRIRQGHLEKAILKSLLCFGYLSSLGELLHTDELAFQRQT